MDGLFSHGRIVSTPGAIALGGRTLTELLEKHLRGDWSSMAQEDQEANREAVIKANDRIFSAFDVGEQSCYIITEQDRSITTCMLAEDY